MSQKIRGIARKILQIAAWVTGIAALFIFMLSATTFLWNNLHRMEHFSAPAGKMFSPEKTNFRFAVTGDIVVNTAIFRPVIETAAKNDPDFILLLGDIVPRHDQQVFNVSSRQLKKILKDKMVCPIPGNHDVAGKGDDNDHLRHYRTLFGPGSYFFTYGNTLFYALDNSRLFYSEEDFQQMCVTLAKLRPLYRNFVFYMHVPPSTVLIKHRRKMMSKEFSDRLEKVLREFRVSVTFCGHLHQYVKTRYAGAPLYVVRPSGQGKDWGYLDVVIKDDKVQVTDVAVPVHSKRITLFPDYEEFKTVQICTNEFFVLAGGFLLFFALCCRLSAKMIRE